MAPSQLMDDPPSAASSSQRDEEDKYDLDGEEEGGKGVVLKETYSEGEDEEEEEETEQDSVSARVSGPRKPDDESGSSEGFESWETNPSPSASDFTIRPIVSMRANDSSKHNVGMTAPSVAGSKRPAVIEPPGKESKRKKKIANGDERYGRRASAFQRLWSEDDEISILKSMIEYTKEKDQCQDVGALHDFIRKSLNVDVSKNQLSDKIRRLKKKYQNNALKCGLAEDPDFAKPHERRAFELSRKVWGGEKNKKQQIQRSRASKPESPTPQSQVPEERQETRNKETKLVQEEFLSKYPWLEGSFKWTNNLCSEPLTHLLRERVPSLGIAKAKELDESWKKLSESELELHLKRLEFAGKQCRLVLDSMRSSQS